MRKSKSYDFVRFSANVVQEALAVWTQQVSSKGMTVFTRTVEENDEKWDLDSDEEFFAAYRRPCDHAGITKSVTGKGARFSFGFHQWYCSASVELGDRSSIERVFDVFEQNLEASRLPLAAKPTPEPPTIFIGHGRSGVWRDLKDHLTDKQGYKISAYEVGARAGHTIRDILQDLLVESSFALLVLTAEDETSTGEMRSRQNVIHELGLFQGKLGFPRAIAVVERGVELMSNLDGIQQLRFSSGGIAEVYGDVIATLRREFGDIR
jgi:predicted nucleotide-binding protein